MGFFSSDCEGCGHPLLSPAATTRINAWMNRGVSILPNGSIMRGDYDGYGRLGDVDCVGIEPATVWHAACFKVAGSPSDYRGESRYSADQGWLFNDPDHDMAEPK